jgi:hypothetical protein
MSSKEFYREILQSSIGQIGAGMIPLKKIPDNEEAEKRKGITLIIPVEADNSEYGEFIKKFSNIEPAQYFYPASDLHVTIFSFISANSS